MEWLKEFKGATIGLDTAPLIYFIEENPRYFDIVRPFFEALDRGDFTVVTSTVTLIEVLVHPLRQGKMDIAEDYREILLNSRLLTLDISSPIAERAAALRAGHNLRTPDAIQMATALHAGATGFFTNDARLKGIPGLKVIDLNQLRGELCP